MKTAPCYLVAPLPQCITYNVTLLRNYYLKLWLNKWFVWFDLILYRTPCRYYRTPCRYYGTSCRYFRTPCMYYRTPCRYNRTPCRCYVTPCSYYGTPWMYFKTLCWYYRTPCRYYGTPCRYYKTPCRYYGTPYRTARIKVYPLYHRYWYDLKKGTEHKEMFSLHQQLQPSELWTYKYINI